MIVARTPRLSLASFSLADVDGFFELNSDPEVIRYTGDRPFRDKAEVARFIADYDHYQTHGFGRWSVYLREGGEYLGFCGLKYSPEHDEIDVGFRILRRYWGRGYATEAARASLAIGFGDYGAARIVARAARDNAGSHAVIRKLGMVYCSSFCEDGVEWLGYELTREQWLAQT